MKRPFATIAMLNAVMLLLLHCQHFRWAGSSRQEKAIEKTHTSEEGTYTVAYQFGELKDLVKFPLDQVLAATHDAAKELEIDVFKEEKNEAKGAARIHFKSKRDTNVYVNLSPFKDEYTRIAIRINVFGNEALSYQVLNEIRERLDLPPYESEKLDKLLKEQEELEEADQSATE